jgi:hypothetical protein
MIKQSERGSAVHDSSRDPHDEAGQLLVGRGVEAWKLLAERHPNLGGLDLPDPEEAAVIRAKCRYVSVLDYRSRFGHHAAFQVG